MPTTGTPNARAKIDNEKEEMFARWKMLKNKTDDKSKEELDSKLWNLKKEIFPKSRDPPTAMVDPASGNLLTSKDKIEAAALDVYKTRLENRPIKADLINIKIAKEKLCKKLLEVAKTRKNTTMEHERPGISVKKLEKGEVEISPWSN